MEEVPLSTLKPGMKDLCCQVMVLDIGGSPPLAATHQRCRRRRDYCQRRPDRTQRVRGRRISQRECVSQDPLQLLLTILRQGGVGGERL